ncbi:MAG: hypothetical protein V1820_01855 [archaeon]
MSKRVLVVRPDDKDELNYLSQWSSEILEFAKGNGIDIDDLGFKESAKERFKASLARSPGLIVFNCHGTPTSILGKAEEELINVKTSDDLKSTIIFARVCFVGQAFEENPTKTKAFLGFTSVFGFPMDPGLGFTPTEDPQAMPFMNITNRIAVSLLKGNTVGDVYQSAIKAFESAIIKAEGSFEPGSFDQLVWLKNDLDCFIQTGDPTVQF